MPRILSFTTGVAAVSCLIAPASGGAPPPPPIPAEVHAICNIMLPTSKCEKALCRLPGSSDDAKFSCAMGDVASSIKLFKTYSVVVEGALAASAPTNGFVRNQCMPQVLKFTKLDQMQEWGGEKCDFSALDITLGSDPLAFLGIARLVMSVPHLVGLRFERTVNMATDTIAKLVERLGLDASLVEEVHETLAMYSLVQYGFRLHVDEAEAHRERLGDLLTRIEGLLSSRVTSENRSKWCHFLYWLTSAVMQGVHANRNVETHAKVSAKDGKPILGDVSANADASCSIGSVADAYKALARDSDHQPEAIVHDMVLHWLGDAAAAAHLPAPAADALLIHPLFGPIVAHLPRDFFYYRQGVAYALDLAKARDAPCAVHVLDKLHVAIPVSGKTEKAQAVIRELHEFESAKAAAAEKATKMADRMKAFGKASGKLGTDTPIPQGKVVEALRTFLHSGESLPNVLPAFAY